MPLRILFQTVRILLRTRVMAIPGDRERLVRLETRAREAEAALSQLKSYVQLLKQKAGSPETAAEEVRPLV